MRTKCFAAVISLLIFFVNTSRAYDDFGASVRASGMGNAYVATADGPSGMFYNPAGLAQTVQYTLYGSYTRQSTHGYFVGYVSDEKPYTLLAAGALPFYQGVVGLGIVQRGSWIKGSKIVTQNTINLSFARFMSNKISLGGNTKFAFNSNYGNNSGADVDVGVMFFATRQLTLGLVGVNLIGTNMLPNDSSAVFVYNRRQFKAGVAYSHYVLGHLTRFGLDAIIKQKSETAIQTNDLYNFGVEQTIPTGLMSNLSFRIGYTTGNDYGQNVNSFAFGTSYEIKSGHNSYRIDYSFQEYPFPTQVNLAGDHRIAFTVGFGTPSSQRWASSTKTPVISRITKPVELKKEATKLANTPSTKSEASKPSSTASTSTGNTTGSSATPNSWNWNDKSSTNTKSDNSTTGGVATSGNTSDATKTQSNQTTSAVSSNSDASTTTSKNWADATDTAAKNSTVAGSTGTNPTSTSSTGSSSSGSNSWTQSGTSTGKNTTKSSAPTGTTPTASTPKTGSSTTTTVTPSPTTSRPNQSASSSGTANTGSTKSSTGASAATMPNTTSSGTTNDASTQTTLSLPVNKVNTPAKKKVYGVDAPSTNVPFTSEPTNSSYKTKSTTGTSGKATSDTKTSTGSASTTSTSPWTGPADTKREERLGDAMQRPAETAIAQVYQETPSVAPVSGKSDAVVEPVQRKLVGFKVSANVETIQSHFSKSSSYMVNLKYDLGDKRTLVKDWKIVIARQDWSEYNDEKVEANAVRVMDSRGIPPSGILWDGKDSGGNAVSSGKYYFTLVLNMVTGETYWSNWQTVKIK